MASCSSRSRRRALPFGTGLLLLLLPPMLPSLATTPASTTSGRTSFVVTSPPISFASFPGRRPSHLSAAPSAAFAIGHGGRRLILSEVGFWRRSTLVTLAAKGRKNRDGDGTDWYGGVDDDASPEDVFWEEMERRKLQSKGYAGEGEDPMEGSSPIDMLGTVNDDVIAGMGQRGYASSSSASSMAAAAPSMGANVGSGGVGGVIPGVSQAVLNNAISEEWSTEAILASYSAFAVADNFLYDDDEILPVGGGGGLVNDPSVWEGDDPTIEEENAALDRQLDELERDLGLLGDGVDGSSPSVDFSLSDEPWDRYGRQQQIADGGGGGSRSNNSRELERKMDMASKRAKEFTLEYDDEHPEQAAAEAAAEEAEYVRRLSSIGITSPRLENAAVNPKANAYFRRSPDELQGYDTMWVSAVDKPCVQNLWGSLADYGIQFADNFGDWEDETDEDGRRSIEDITSCKARKVFEVTGLPCITSRTSFEVEAIRPEDAAAAAAAERMDRDAGGRKSKTPAQSPLVSSGYRFNDMGDHVDRVIEALRPLSQPTRVTRYRSCVCYYDGDLEIFEYGELDCDLYFASSMRTFIPMASAINSMIKSLEIALDLKFQNWLKSKANDLSRGAAGETRSAAGIKLRDRVLKEAKVLPNDIVDVSSFMDAFVDVELMDECGRELADRFVDFKPSKILTIATTGLVIAFPMAKYLQVPLVYARKQRSLVMADTYDAGYNSKTVGKDRQLIVSRSHIDEDDRILIVDDFLSSGSSQEALLRIISEAGAKAVGVAVVLEKQYDAGRKSLSGFDVPVESMVRIASVRDGVIQLLEEDGYDKM